MSRIRRVSDLVMVGFAQDSRREGNVGEMAMIQIRDVSGASI